MMHGETESSGMVAPISSLGVVHAVLRHPKDISIYVSYDWACYLPINFASQISYSL